MMTVRVRWALRTVGSRNARTPLLTASTPVIAVQPFEKTCSSSHSSPAVDRGAGRHAGGATTGIGWPPARTVLNVPMTISREQRAEE